MNLSDNLTSKPDRNFGLATHPDLTQLKTLIFDLDGVITSEQKYWNTARLTVWEMICSESYLGLKTYFGEPVEVSNLLTHLGQQIIPDSFIYELKSRAVNSNWDLTFFVVCLHLVGLLQELRKTQSSDSVSQVLNQLDLSLSEQLQKLNQLFQESANPEANRSEHTSSIDSPSTQVQNHLYTDRLSTTLIEQFWQETQTMQGADVLNHVQNFLERQLAISFPALAAKGEFWQLCYQNFQDWYEGKKGYLLPDDETVVDLDQIAVTLNTLKEAGYRLAIATGRPRNEVIQPLTTLGLLQYFDPQAIGTYDEVLQGEAILQEISNSDPPIKLGKPHPFILFKVMFPQEAIPKLCDQNFAFERGQEIAYIGDAGSDVVAAKKAGCVSIGVLTGFGDEKARNKKREMLSNLGCDIILDSVLELPKALNLN